MSFDIPAYIEPRIQKFASTQQITEDEAVIRLIEAGLDSQLGVASEAFSSVDRERWADRAARRKMIGDAFAGTRPESPDALFTFLADSPETAQAIRDLATERRANSYGI